MSEATSTAALEELRFDNQFTRELPSDPRADNQRRQVEGACYSRVSPKGMRAPAVIGFAKEVAEAVGLESLAHAESLADLSDGYVQAISQVFSGSDLMPGMDPHACCYGGHQFGNWAGQLGDGRAINLGEVLNAQGERWMLQLKGAGPTPYSRTADGLAVMRSSVREFLCSEAMHHLGVPTTRALSLVGTGEDVSATCSTMAMHVQNPARSCVAWRRVSRALGILRFWPLVTILMCCANSPITPFERTSRI